MKCVYASALLMLLVACRPTLPAPAYPLVATPSDDVPVPAAGEVSAPAFPRVSEVRIGGGALWYTDVQTHEGVSILVQSRRGEDGAHPRELTRFMASVLEEQLRQRLPQIGVGSGSDVNGTWISIYTSAEHIDATFAALSEVLDGSAPPEAIIERSRDMMILNVVRSQHALISASMEAARDQLHGREANLEQGLRALRPIIEEFDVTAVEEARHERFAAEDRAFIVTGDFDAATLRASFRRHLGTERPAVARQAPAPVQSVVPEHPVLSRYVQTSQVYVVFARSAPPPTHEDRLAYDLIVDLLGGTFGSQLNGSLRETHSYTYGAHAFVSRSRDADVLFIESAFEPDDVRGALETLFDELRTIRSRTFSVSDIDGARNRIWARVSEAVQGSGLAAALSIAWERRWVPRRLEAAYASLAEVTPEIVQAVARRQFTSQKAILIVTGDFRRVTNVLVERDADGYHLR